MEGPSHVIHKHAPLNLCYGWKKNCTGFALGIILLCVYLTCFMVGLISLLLSC